jgi:hypothetical protein
MNFSIVVATGRFALQWMHACKPHIGSFDPGGPGQRKQIVDGIAAMTEVQMRMDSFPIRSSCYCHAMAS